MLRLYLGALAVYCVYKDSADRLECFDVITYADDTVIFISKKNVRNIKTRLNIDLEKISTFFYLNELVINIKKGKTKVMLFSSSQQLKKGWKSFKCHVYKGNKINFVTQYNYVGTIIDNHLNLNNFNYSYKCAST